MFRLTLTLLPFLLLQPAASQWVQQFSDNNIVFNDISIASPDIIFVCGEKFIFKTTNGGANWFTSRYNISEIWFGIDFINEYTGWVVGNNGKVSKTTNGGLNWIQKNSEQSVDLLDVDFVDSAVGYICGGTSLSGVVIKSINGSDNWSLIRGAQYPFTDFYCLQFINSATGYVGAGGEAAGFLKTTNGGISWFVKSVHPNENFPVVDISFVNENTGYFLRNYPSIHKTTDGGNTVTQLNTPYLVERMTAINEDSIYTTARGSIYFTPNCGGNWIEQFADTNIYFNSIRFLSSDTGYAIGSKGTILKTINGGEPLGIQQVSNHLPKRYILGQNYPNPFNPVTNIKFDVIEKGLVRIYIYDVLGRMVHQLVNRQMNAGSYKVDWDASNYPAGIYFYRLEAGKYSESKKMVLVK